VQTTWGTGQAHNPQANLNHGVSTIADKQYQAARKAGKKLAFMHYYMGGDPAAEAAVFKTHNTGYFGTGIPMIDWEDTDNPYVTDADMFGRVLDAFARVQGGPGIVYYPQKYYAALKPVADARNWGSFVAQYANTSPTGIQETPWNEGAYACTLRQYSSNGQIGVGTSVDLDKFYGDGAAWDAYVRASTGTGTAPAPVPPAPAPSAPQPKVVAGGYTVAVDALNVRTAPTKNAAVVATYNKGEKVTLDGWGTYADGILWGRYRGGSGNLRYVAVGTQDGKTWYLTLGSSTPQRTHLIQPGETLDGIAKKYGRSVQYLAQLNSIPNPDRIQAGATIRI
jgi:hypothetical protein